jgi:hypothetical protein
MFSSYRLTFGCRGRRVVVGSGSWLREQLLKHDGLLGQLLCPVSPPPLGYVAFVVITVNKRAAVKLLQNIISAST